MSVNRREAEALRHESNRFILASSLSNSSSRTASYTPTLEEFKGRFCDYIRETLLGVELCSSNDDNKEEKVCRDKLNDGLAKITPPEGWWDYKGIECDLTGRGSAVSYV